MKNRKKEMKREIGYRTTSSFYSRGNLVARCRMWFVIIPDLSVVYTSVAERRGVQKGLLIDRDGSDGSLEQNMHIDFRSAVIWPKSIRMLCTSDSIVPISDNEQARANLNNKKDCKTKNVQLTKITRDKNKVYEQISANEKCNEAKNIYHAWETEGQKLQRHNSNVLDSSLIVEWGRNHIEKVQ